MDTPNNSQPSPDRERRLFYIIFFLHLALSSLFFVFVLLNAIGNLDDDPNSLYQQSLARVTAVLGDIFVPFLSLPFPHMSSWIVMVICPFLVVPIYSMIFAKLLSFVLIRLQRLYNLWMMDN